VSEAFYVLVLRGSGDFAFNSEAAQESRDIILGQIARMAFAVEKDEALDPGEISLFGAQTVVPETQKLAHLL
jgi:hypothetical protein